MSTDKTKIVMNSTEDILAALDSGDPSVVVAVLRAIARDPRKALSYGPSNGRELTAELAKRFLSAKGNIFKTGFFSAMVAIDAPAYLEAYKKGFFMNECPEIMLASASKLAERQEGEVRDFLATVLFNDAMPKQAQLAANIMTRFSGLDTRETIRVALLANRGDAATPAFGEDTRQAWIAELCGPLQDEAKLVLEHDCGESGYRLFKAGWSELPLQVRVWVLEWGARDHPVYALDLLADSLDSGNSELTLAALRGFEALPALAKYLEGKIAKLVHADDRVMRITALKALPESDEKIVAELLRDEELLLIALKKLPAKKDHEKLLFDLLADGNWAIRSVATKKILELGPSAAEYANEMDYSRLGQGMKVALSRIFKSFDRGDLVEALAKTGGIR